LERKRWLRCGRCGSGWEREWLRCPFCDEQSHEQLGYLAPEEGEATRKVEVCDSCKGYLKAHATVSALPPCAVLLEDLTTVPLDVAALDRGYRRPERPGYALEARVEDGGGWWRLWRRVEAVSTNLHQLPPGRAVRRPGGGHGGHGGDAESRGLSGGTYADPGANCGVGIGRHDGAGGGLRWRRRRARDDVGCRHRGGGACPENAREPVRHHLSLGSGFDEAARYDESHTAEGIAW